MKNLIVIISLFFSMFLAAENVDLNLINAREEFRWGVKAYNDGLYSKAVFSFEKSLSFEPDNIDTHFWLGRSYYMSGDIDAAVKEWNIVQESGTAPSWLDSYVEIIQAQRGVLGELYEVERWVPLLKRDVVKPGSVYPLNDGSHLIVSFFDNHILKVNANGALIETFTGGLDSFNHPLDIISDGKEGYILTEVMGDRVSFMNSWGQKTGSTAPDDGFSGPQYLTSDSMGYFYVSDWGNKRICKFDMEGNYVFSFSHKKLKGPSGIVWHKGSLYVADQIQKSLYRFDKSGNFLETVLDGELSEPEGITALNDSTLYIGDGNALKMLDLDSGTLSIVSDLEGKALKVLKGGVDSNGNILVSDLNLNTVVSLTDVSSLYGGLFPVIERIDSSEYPKIVVDITVRNRRGEPVVGLDNSNFILSENYYPAESRNVIFKGYRTTDVSTAVVLDMNSAMADKSEELLDVVSTLGLEKQEKDAFIMISGSEFPSLEAKSISEAEQGIRELSPEDFTDSRKLDTAIRLAASSLIPSRIRRNLVVVSNGVFLEDSFGKYGLLELTEYLKNNNIVLNVVYTGSSRLEELDYLSRETGGRGYSLKGSRGIVGLVDNQRSLKNGTYALEYHAVIEAGPREEYIPFELEVIHIRKSGRSESGYFAVGQTR